jgi:hypothetical protein
MIVHHQVQVSGDVIMPNTAKYLFVVSMDVAPDKEDLFNEVYDSEHIPYLTSVPGVVSATRSTLEPLTMMLAGEKQTIGSGDEPKYSVTYAIESPGVLLSDAWAAAGERGRWPTEVRPHTTNRRHILRRIRA